MAPLSLLADIPMVSFQNPTSPHSQQFQKTHFDLEVEVTEILSPLTFLVNAPVVSISENLTSDREVSEIQTHLTSLPVVSIRGSYVSELLHSQT